MTRIAYFEPVSGLNVYGRELLPELAQLDEIDVYTDANTLELDKTVVTDFCVRPFGAFASRSAHYDHLVFQLRNNPLHTPVYDLLLSYGGVAVLHELNLSGIIGANTFGRGRRFEFLHQLLLTEGAAAFLETCVKLLLHRQWPSWSDYDMNARALKRSQGVIVHSKYAYQKLHVRYSALPIQKVDRGVPQEEAYLDPIQARQGLGLQNYGPILASFGVVHWRKRIHVALEAIAEIVSEFPNLLYVLVGTVHEFDLDGIVTRLGLENHVRSVGYVDIATFNRYMAATDVGINLRYPSQGETSSVALRLLGAGKPLLVTNDGALTELPDGCALKIAVGPREKVQIREALLRLGRDPELRRRMGEAGRTYVRTHHTWKQAAATYHRFLERLASLG